MKPGVRGGRRRHQPTNAPWTRVIRFRSLAPISSLARMEAICKTINHRGRPRRQRMPARTSKRRPDHAAHQRQGPPTSHRSADDAARLHPRDRCSHRNEEGLRPRAMRRLHGACEWPAREFLPEPGLDARRGRDHHHRGARHARRIASHAGGVRRLRRLPVRLLHVGPDHVGRRAAQGTVRSRRRGREGADERQHLPLRGLRQHRGRDPTGSQATLSREPERLP